jgi:hypothetical protein
VAAGASSTDTGLTLRASGVRLRLAALGWRAPDAAAPRPRAVLRLRVAVEAAPFAGAFETDAGVAELQTLRQMLADLDAAAAGPRAAPVRRAFQLATEAVRLDFELTPRGALTIEAVLHAPRAPRRRLTAVLAADQTYLPRWVTELDALLAAFPPTPMHG